MTLILLRLAFKKLKASERKPQLEKKATHAKLTIASAVRKELGPTDNRPSSVPQASPGKQMLSKIYNRLDSHREVGIPEAISHLCGFPDRYTSGTFVNINTKILLCHIKRRHLQMSTESANENLDVFDSEILATGQGYRLMSPFDDYIHRGDHLSQLCLYNYYSLFNKERSRKGIRFDNLHPQADSHCQILCRSSLQVPNLLGRLMFLRPDSDDQQVKEDYYCLVAPLFVPWSHHRPLNPSVTSWQDWYLNLAPPPPPRIPWLVRNLQLLHKTKNEIEFD